MKIKKILISICILFYMQSAFSDNQNYFVIDPLNEISITQNALLSYSFDQRNLIDFTFHPEKQTGQNQVFNSEEMKKIQLENLESEQIVKILYPLDLVEIPDAKNMASTKKIFNFFNYKYYEKCECLGGKKLIQQNIFVRPQKIIQFKNINKENRFLIPVEVWDVNSVDEDMYLTSPRLELYVFKKIKNSHYQLVTRTPINYEGIGLHKSSGILLIESSLKEMASNIRLIGEDRVGSYFKTYETQRGAVFSDWNVLSLKEDEFIRSYLASSASEDTHEMFYRSHPHKYDSKLTVIPVKGKSYYPIKTQYKGNRFSISKYKLEDKNQTNILEFDPRLRIYSYDESTMQRILLDESNK